MNYIPRFPVDESGRAGSLGDALFSFEQIVATTSDVVIVTKVAPLAEPGPEIVYVNNAFTELTGYRAEEVIGGTPRILQGPETCPETRAKIRAALEAKSPIRTTIVNYSKSGQKYWLDINLIPLIDSSGNVDYFAAIERDITEEMLVREKLEALSLTDDLTGLMNRRHLLGRLEDEVVRSRRYGHPLSVMMVDIDRFKSINDTHGHQVGDRALAVTAHTLLGNVRATDLVSRLGGEEFALVLPETGLELGSELAERLRAAIADARLLRGPKEISWTASFGLAELSPDDGAGDDLLARADRALYAAKEAGRDCVSAC